MGKVIAGSHKAHAISVVMIESSEKKTPGVTVVLSVDEDGDMKGATIEWTGWLTDATKARTAESLSLLGCTDEDLLRISQADGPVAIKNPQGVIIVCEEEEYDKRDGSKGKAVRVRWINDPNRGGAGFAQMAAEKKAKFGDELRGLLLKQNADKAEPKEDPMSFPPGAPVKQPKW